VPDGYFVITFLPSVLSYTEKISQWLGRPNHTRRYSLSKLQNILLHSGFVILEAKRFLMVPTVIPGADKLWPLNALLEKLWPLNLLSSNLFVVAQKKNYML